MAIRTLADKQTTNRILALKKLLQVEISALPIELRLVAALAIDPVSEDIQSTKEQLGKGEIDWNAFSGWLDKHEVVPIVYKNICRLDRDIFPERVRRKLAAHTFFNSFRSSRQTDEIFRLTGLLASHGIPAVPLKGTLLAFKLYGDPGHREVGDIDLQVPQDQLFYADEIIRNNGYRRQYPDFDLSPRQRRAFVLKERHITYSHPWTLELHWDRSWNCARQFQKDTISTRVGRHQLRTLAGEEQFIQLCIHGADHGWTSLKWLADIHCILLGSPSLDWRRVELLCGHSGAERMVLQTILLVNVLFGSPVSDKILSRTARFSMPKNVVRTPIRNLARREKFNPGPLFGIPCIWYQFQLRKGIQKIRFLLMQFHPYSIDWKTVPISDRFFALYYFIRPWLWLRRKLKPSCTLQGKDREC